MSSQAKHRRPRKHRRGFSPSPLVCLEGRVLLSMIAVDVDDDLEHVNDSNVSLRKAIEMANQDGGGDVIQFAISGANPITINLTSPLPPITAPVMIDGTSQFGVDPTNPLPMIVLNGAGAGAGADGLRITGGGSTVRGLAFVGFAGDAIRLESGGGNQIVDDWIGVAPGSVAGPGNLGNGIAIVNSPGNVIGGGDATDRNVIAGFGQNAYSAAFNFSTSSGRPRPIPLAVTAADVNRDGTPDLVAANFNTSTISVLPGVADGTFLAPLSAPTATGSGPTSIVTGDFDRNGIPDFLTTNAGDADLTLLLGQPDGTYQAKTITPEPDHQPLQVVVGDFAGNGVQDIAVVSVASDFVDVLLGNGDGTFQDPVQYPAGPSPSSIEVGNLFGDGKLDLVTTNADGVAVLRNIGNGQFSSQPILSPATSSPRTVAVGDFNGDGKLDLAVGDFSDTGVRLLLGDGAGNFSAGNHLETGSSVQQIVTGDFFHDGKVDLAAVNSGSNLIDVFLGVGATPIPTPIVLAANGFNSSGLIAADLRGTGRLDLAIANLQTDDVSVFLNTPASQNGILIQGAGSTGNIVAGNFIGTDSTGRSPLGNGLNGIKIDGAAGNTIGGLVSGVGNLIAGNLGGGVAIVGAGAVGNVVLGNTIGLAVDGVTPLGNGGDGIAVSGAPGNTIGATASAGGNIIASNGGNGIAINGSGASRNVVFGNRIGTVRSGATASGNGLDGVLIQGGAAGNTIGGAAVGAGNILAGSRGGASGNGGHGVAIEGTGTTQNVVLGNRIGTSGDGLSALANSTGGVVIQDGAAGNTIGGAAAGAGNLISGNGAAGILVAGAGTSNNVLLGNQIGTDATGTVTLGNASHGVVIDSAAQNTLGGTAAGSGNLIAGNKGSGLAIVGKGATGNQAIGNRIGLAAGTGAPLGNGQDGVFINGAAANTIGGSTAAAANVISANHSNGVELTAGAVGNVVLGNRIGTDPAGALVAGNAAAGVLIGDSPANTVGGLGSAAGNVISGNGGDGVRIDGVGASSNAILGNRIGSDLAGLAPLGNGGDGVFINGAAGNAVGAAGAGNLIVGNRGSGVELNGSGATRNTVQANQVGTGGPGSGPAHFLANNRDGVRIANAPDNLIGGTATGTGNVISANLGNGIQIVGAGATGNLLAGNFVGTDASGTVRLGNVLNGVLIDGGSRNTVGTAVRTGANVISANASAGVQIISATGNVVLGNLIGTDGTGTASLGNAGDGVSLTGAAGNTIGGSDAGAGNVISGNLNGVTINGGAATGNMVQGNFVGTNAAGDSALGNQLDGLAILGAPGNLIGGGAAGARNVISGNRGNGIDISGGAAADRVQGNYIGVNAAGTSSLGNAIDGVFVNQSPGVILGGVDPGTGNLVSGNGLHGIVLFGSGTSGAQVLGNRIGTDIAGERIVGNAQDGVLIDEAPANTVGGTAPGAGNLISGNGASGVQILGGGAGANLVQGNRIGIDLAGVKSLGNIGDGVLVDGAPANLIGGSGDGSGRNTISGNGGSGVRLSGSGSAGNVVSGNFIGSNLAGAAALGNAVHGILVAGAPGTMVGGTAAGAGNLVSGNLEDGVHVAIAAGAPAGPSGFLAIIQGNRIGTDATGTRALGNAAVGIDIENTSATLIGGTGPTAGNLVSGNAGAGIELIGPGSSGDRVEGNRIGTDAAGRSALANGFGVLLNAAPANTLGGTASGAGNLISGNTSAGVQIFGVGASNNVLLGNRIGLDATGAVPLGNGVGVFIDDVGAETIGGLAPGSGNLISGNATAGVYIAGRNATGNLVVGNIIGPDPSGNAAIINPAQTTGAVASQALGVLISDAVGNTIGGTSAGARNLVSGNLVGVEIAGNDTELPAVPNVVVGNFIGTTASGQAALGNGVGIYINDAAYNLIGGTAPGARNVISGNTSYGVYLFGSLTTKNTVQGNFLGVAADGRTVFRTASGSFLQQVGVAFENASRNTIGGLQRGAGNVLTGNDQAGVYIFGRANSSQGNVIQRNMIGTNADGTPGAGNRQYGVLLFNAPNNLVDKSSRGRNRFGRNGIADVREFTGSVHAGSTHGPARKRSARHVSRQVSAQIPQGPIHAQPPRTGKAGR